MLEKPFNKLRPSPKVPRNTRFKFRLINHDQEVCLTTESWTKRKFARMSRKTTTKKKTLKIILFFSSLVFGGVLPSFSNSGICNPQCPISKAEGGGSRLTSPWVQMKNRLYKPGAVLPSLTSPCNPTGSSIMHYTPSPTTTHHPSSKTTPSMAHVEGALKRVKMIRLHLLHLGGDGTSRMSLEVDLFVKWWDCDGTLPFKTNKDVYCCSNGVLTFKTEGSGSLLL